MKKYFFVLTLSSLSFGAYSADLIVSNAKVTRVTNTNQNTESFTLTTSGGSGPCAGQAVVFSASETSEKIHNRAFTIALSAYSIGDKVTIYSYTGASCSKAAYIELSK